MTVGYSPRAAKVNRKFLPRATASFCLKTGFFFFGSFLLPAFLVSYAKSRQYTSIYVNLLAYLSVIS